MNTKLRLKGKYQNVKKGRAIDLGDDYFASGWERDFARFLNLLVSWGIVEGWQYEPQRFNFIGHYNSNPLFYVPDFVVKFSHRNDKFAQDVYSTLKPLISHAAPGKTVWVEVKGIETGTDRNKWRRFRKVTQNTLDVVKKREMKQIQLGFAPLIPKWESNIY